MMPIVLGIAVTLALLVILERERRQWERDHPDEIENVRFRK